MKYVKFAALMRNDLIMIFTRYAKISDDRNENQIENFEHPCKPLLITLQLNPHNKKRIRAVSPEEEIPDD